jgi:hypothetical protein
MMSHSDGGADWVPHPVLANISADDPELGDILRGIGKPAIPINDVITSGPFGRTSTYDHTKSHDSGEKKDCTGLLKTWVSAGRRFVFAIDYAKYLLAVKRIGKSRPHRQNIPRRDRRDLVA